MLLADVFRKFIKTCLEHNGLGPCDYFSSPGLSSDEMFKVTEIELELISDNDGHLFAEKVMAGGIFYIAKRFSKANNKYFAIIWC